jgi:hypothetical protein
MLRRGDVYLKTEKINFKMPKIYKNFEKPKIVEREKNKTAMEV